MNDNNVQADSFILKSHGIRLYRIKQQGCATIIFGCCEEASRYLQEVQGQGLQAAKKGR